MCIEAATGSVNSTLAAVSEIVDFTFVPWGNAYYGGVTGNKTYDRGPGLTYWLNTCGMGVADPPTACFEGDILCQHGANECAGNLIEGCVKSELKEDSFAYWPFMACFEGQDIDRVNPSSPSKALHACASQLGWTAARTKEVEACVASPESAHKVSVENAKKTAALVPAHAGTPWLLVNGKSVEGDDLLAAVCAAYDGPKPARCANPSTDGDDKARGTLC